MTDRKCFPEHECPQSEIFTSCIRNDMYFHIAKIPIKIMMQIVVKYNLVRFPFALTRRTMVNVITDCTDEDVWNELENGESKS